MSSPFEEPVVPEFASAADPVFTNEDADQLRILSIFYYVLAGLGFVCGFAPVFHMAFGAAMALAPQTFENQGHEADTVLRLFGAGFFCFAGSLMLLSWTLAVLQIVAGRSLATQRRHTFCVVVAALNCLWFPFGMALGVFSLIVLMRPGVKARFQAADRLQFG